MGNSINRVSLAFVQCTDDELPRFAGGVVTGMAAPAFAAAPVSTEVMTARQADYVQKLAISQNGGKKETAAKNVSRLALIAALRLNAAFVQMIASTDLPLLLASGYRPTSSNRTSGPLTKPIIVNVDNFQSTILLVTAEADSRAKAQEARYRIGDGPYQAAGVQTKATRILFDGLVPGTMYELQLRSVGGSTGYSDWSDPVSRMAT